MSSTSDLLYAATAGNNTTSNNLQHSVAAAAAAAAAAVATPTSMTSRMTPYFPYEPITFGNKISSSSGGFDGVGSSTSSANVKKLDNSKQNSSCGGGGHSFPNQLIALNQIRNYASIPLSSMTTVISNGDNLKEE